MYICIFVRRSLCFVTMNKTLYLLLSTGSTQEDPPADKYNSVPDKNGSNVKYLNIEITKASFQ